MLWLERNTPTHLTSDMRPMNDNTSFSHLLWSHTCNPLHSTWHLPHSDLPRAHSLMHAYIKEWFAHIKHDFANFQVTFSVSHSHISSSNLLWWIESNRTTWIDAIISYRTPIGWWRCRSLVVNTIKRSHLSGSRSWWTIFLWARRCWRTSTLPNSPIRARSLLWQVSSLSFSLRLMKCPSIFHSHRSSTSNFRTDLHF